MGYWNQRVICKKDKKSKRTSYQIHEVYYSKNGKIKGWTESPVYPYADIRKELINELKNFQNALKYPILVEKTKDKKTILVEIKNT
jgi:hypothetical protein